MSQPDLQLGGGYTYQWRCAILLFCRNKPLDRGDATRFVFLTNQSFNDDLERIRRQIEKGVTRPSEQLQKLIAGVVEYAEDEHHLALDPNRVLSALKRTILINFMPLGAVRASVQVLLLARGRQDWAQAYDTLFARFAERSEQQGGGEVTHQTLTGILGAPRDSGRRRLELDYLKSLVRDYGYWDEKYTALAGTAEVRVAEQNGQGLNLPARFMPASFEKLHEFGLGEQRRVERVSVDDLREAVREYRRLVLLGEPGSGKFTTLWRLAFDYAQAALDDPTAPIPVLAPLGGYSGPESALTYVQTPAGATIGEARGLSRSEF